MGAIIDISGYIAAKVVGVSGVKAVYEYKPDKPTDGGYPYAVVTPAEFQGQFGDTIRNLRTHTFVLSVYQERTEAGFGNQKAERLIREMSDEIITAFDQDTTFSGMIKYMKPLHGNLRYDEGETGEMRVCEFILDCVVISPSS
jgi:hypothetical protein